MLISRWKCRHLNHFKKAHGKNSIADFASAEEWKSTILAELIHQFTSDNIYNADETGLFCRATPDGSLS